MKATALKKPACRHCREPRICTSSIGPLFDVVIASGTGPAKFSFFQAGSWWGREDQDERAKFHRFVSRNGQPLLLLPGDSAGHPDGPETARVPLPRDAARDFIAQPDLALAEVSIMSLIM